MKKILSLLFVLLVMMPAEAKKLKFGFAPAAPSQKEEFRGTWLQTAFQERYMKLPPEECKAYLQQVVDQLYETGFNAIFFQVRPEGDAFYQSPYEPWSRFLTAQQGLAPRPYWDPL